MKLFGLLVLAVGILPTASCQSTPKNMKPENFPITKTDDQWKAELTPEQFRVLRQKGTEYPGSGIYDQHFKPGHYTCAGCRAKLFISDRKFDAHCGWPSFDAQSEDSNVIERVDYSHGMVRTEILCKQCGGHLGHVFNDGPTETGLRYCVNSASLNFEEGQKK